MTVHYTWTDETTEFPELLDMLARARPKWQADAACREHPELSWFPELGSTSGAAALRVCVGCLVRWECLEWALGQGSQLRGIWGATTARERRNLRRTKTPR